MQPLFEACRWANQYLGIIGCIFVLWRLIPLVLERHRWADPESIRLHRILIFGVLAGFEIFSAFAAAHGVGSPLRAIWTSLAFTVLHTSTIVLTVWWPHPRPPAPS